LSEPHQNSFQAFEELTQRIIAAFRTHEDLGEDVIRMWCGDAKEMYCSTLLARDLLLRKNPPDTRSASGMLSAASTYCRQVASELRALDAGGTELEQELHRMFQGCHDELAARIPKVQEAQAGTPPERVIRVSDEEYTLPCSVCGSAAVTFKRANGEEKILRGLVCAGISRSFGLDPQYQQKVLDWLASEDLNSVHRYFENDLDIDGGLDAYCPECDRIYCHAHYNMRQEWDEGFYDCCYGTCPQGHHRMIDD